MKKKTFKWIALCVVSLMLFAASAVPAPTSISQAENGTIVFKPIDDVKKIQDKQHYMVVVHNRYDDKWYALAYDDAHGDQRALAPAQRNAQQDGQKERKAAKL